MPLPQTPHEATAEATLKVVVHAEGDRLRRFLRGGGVSREDADEVANESFARLWRAMRARTVRNPKAFLFMIARNVVSTRIRKAGAGKRGGGIATCSLNDDRTRLVERLLGDESFEVHASVNIHELGEIINLALTKLSRRHHDVFSLCVLKELSRKNAARELKMTEAAVMTELHRAKRSLRREIQKKLGERK